MYSLRLRSRWPLPCPRANELDPADVEVFEAPAQFFSKAHRQVVSKPEKEEWFQHRRLSDGSDYLRWVRLFEFLVSPDGRRIAGHPLKDASWEAFSTYLLGQVLSFTLIKLGIEPLHSTTVVINGNAVAFAGDCGSGKSTLGASFVQAGHALLTDDLLVVQEEGHGWMAYPGPSRIKLFPAIAKRLLGKGTNGTPMNNFTPKLVIPLEQDGKMFCQDAAPLKALFILTPPMDGPRTNGITIRRLSPRRAFVALLKNSFNTVVVEPARLKRQFDLTTRLVCKAPVKSVSFPRRLACLPAVREAILSDVTA